LNRSLPTNIAGDNEQETEVKIGSDKFISQQDAIQSELIKHTVGLVKLEDFQKIKASLDKKRQEEIERELAKRWASFMYAWLCEQWLTVQLHKCILRSRTKTVKKRKKLDTKSKLSFDMEEGAEEDGEQQDMEST
jgi:protein FAM50